MTTRPLRWVAESEIVHGASDGAPRHDSLTRFGYPSDCVFADQGALPPCEPDPVNDLSLVHAGSSPSGPVVPCSWFSPTWINDDYVPCANHGEFTSPVWLATSLALRCDRDLDAGCVQESSALHIPGTEHANRGGQLRGLLSCVALALNATDGLKAHPPEPTEAVEEKRAWVGHRNHCLRVRPTSQIRSFARFVATNVRKVSVNPN